MTLPSVTFKNLYTHYMPLIAPVLLIVVQALISNGVIKLTGAELTLIDTVLGALGLHSLHVRTK